jgi:hypothetical protein
MQEASFFVKPGVRDGRVVNASQGILKDRSKLGRIMSTSTETKEEVTDCSLLVSPVTGEPKDAAGHSEYESSEDSGGVCRVGWNVQI